MFDGNQLEWAAKSSNTNALANDFKKGAWVKNQDLLKTCADGIEKITVVPACKDDWHGKMMIKRYDLNDSSKKFWRVNTFRRNFVQKDEMRPFLL